MGKQREILSSNSEYSLCGLAQLSKGRGDAARSWGGAKGELLTLQVKWAVRTRGKEGVGGGERPVNSTLHAAAAEQ